MTYESTVRYLYSLGNEVKAAKLGLERMTALLDALGRPERGRAFVHVAGTNGKGSTCAMIESGLRAAGVRTGLYTSPHLAEPTERIRIAGEPVSREEFSGAFDRVHAVAERLIAEGEFEAHPTYFETVTAMALLLFRDLDAEVTVLEVGLGGRLDATNVVMPRLAVITPVDFDHESFLGRGLEAIAAEKAGILKKGVPAVFSVQRPEAARTLDAHAAALGIEPVRTSDWHVRELELQPGGSRFVAVPAWKPLPPVAAQQPDETEPRPEGAVPGDFQGSAAWACGPPKVMKIPAGEAGRGAMVAKPLPCGRGSATAWNRAATARERFGRSRGTQGDFMGSGIQIDCPLAGEHQVENALTAVAALDALGYPPEVIAQGIRQARWPGRLERVSECPELILDGAHNPAGARTLARYIERFYSGRRVWLIYGAMRDKAVTEMAGILFPLAAEVILTSPAQARAVRPEALQELVDHPRLRTAARLAHALALVRGEAAPEDAVFVSGSLFLVGEARALLGLQ